MNDNSEDVVRDLLGFSWRLKHLRTEVLHLTMREMAARLGISQPHLNNLERGRYAPRPELLDAIITTFEVNRNWLLYGTEQPLVSGPAFSARHMLEFRSKLLTPSNQALLSALAREILEWQEGLTEDDDYEDLVVIESRKQQEAQEPLDLQQEPPNVDES